MKKHKKHPLFDAKKLFDWWSVPHFMFGIVTALFSISFSWNAPLIFLATLILALLWELLEKFVRLSEAPGNGWVDVVLPLLAFVMTFILVDQAALNHERHLGLLTITLLLYGFINMIAWRARLEKDRDFLL
jgi:positive regulator of sigma E activity